MQPHDMAFVLAGLLETPATSAAAPAGAAAAAPADCSAHAGHAMPPLSNGWVAPPMYPGVLMPPSLMTLRPDVTSYRPGAGAGAPVVQPRSRVRLNDGDTLELVAAPVRRTIDGRTETTLGFNGQYPGPLIDVPEAARVTVRFVNGTDWPTAIHWHGLRLENRFDGVPHLTQPLVEPGSSFDYRLTFPDPGVFWYHPHHREDVLQDLGLHSNILVRPAAAAFLGPAHREEVLVLDDELVGEGGLVGYGRESPTHALMGRFGNRLLTTASRAGRHVRREGKSSGSTSPTSRARGCSTCRSTGRPRRAIGRAHEGGGLGPRTLRAGSLGGRGDHRTRGALRGGCALRGARDVRLVNRVRGIDHVQARFFDETTVLGTVTVSRSLASPDLSARFSELRRDSLVEAEVDRHRRAHADRPPDYELRLSLQVGDVPFPLRALMQFESVYRAPVEWTGTMPEMDWVVTGQRAQWLLQDARTGLANAQIAWRFKKGDLVKSAW